MNDLKPSAAVVQAEAVDVGELQMEAEPPRCKHCKEPVSPILYGIGADEHPRCAEQVEREGWVGPTSPLDDPDSTETQLLTVLEASPGLTSIELAERVGMSLRQVEVRLEAARELGWAAVGVDLRWRPTPAASQLAEVAP